MALDLEIESKGDFNDDFVLKMENRMRMGFFRYGSWKDNRANVDAVKSALTRIEEYKKTGNTEYLVDAANFLMMEFTLPFHPNAHFKPAEQGESPKIVKF